MTNIKRYISDYYHVSQKCAEYMYYRILRSKNITISEKYLPWTLSIQNLLVLADNIKNLNWDDLKFGYEESFLSTFNIPSNNHEVIRNTNNEEIISELSDDMWIPVLNKKQKKEKKRSVNMVIELKKIGFFI
jgi:hypothetical protein